MSLVTSSSHWSTWLGPGGPGSEEDEDEGNQKEQMDAWKEGVAEARDEIEAQEGVTERTGEKERAEPTGMALGAAQVSGARGERGEGRESRRRGGGESERGETGGRRGGARGARKRGGGGGNPLGKRRSALHHHRPTPPPPTRRPLSPGSSQRHPCPSRDRGSRQGLRHL